MPPSRKCSAIITLARKGAMESTSIFDFAMVERGSGSVFVTTTLRSKGLFSISSSADSLKRPCVRTHTHSWRLEIADIGRCR